jgi:ferredoxin-NADP reductase
VLEQGQQADWPGASESGRISSEMLRHHMPADAGIYYCGSPGFMAAAEHCLGAPLVPAPLRHGETFGPDLSFGDAIDHSRPRAISVQ